MNSVGGADAFPGWTNDTEIDCCYWGEIQCSSANGYVIGINFFIKKLSNSNLLLNLSLLHPFEELQSLNITDTFIGWFDPLEGAYIYTPSFPLIIVTYFNLVCCQP